MKNQSSPSNSEAKPSSMDEYLYQKLTEMQENSFFDRYYPTWKKDPSYVKQNLKNDH